MLDQWSNSVRVQDEWISWWTNLKATWHGLSNLQVTLDGNNLRPMIDLSQYSPNMSRILI